MLIVLGILSVIAAGSTASGQNPAASAIVRTDSGIVRGAIEDDLVVFRGIPYAAPPVGPLRWKPPQTAESWEGIRDAAGFGPPCPSIDTSRIPEGRLIAVGGAAIFTGVPLAPGSNEDCLHLNVWAPMSAEEAAVMVWSSSRSTIAR